MSKGDSTTPGAVANTALGAFYYSSLQTMLAYWQVDPAVAAKLLPSGLVPAVFDGAALVNLNFERYATVGGSFDGIVNEVEINVVAVPTRLAAMAYQLTTQQFFQGDDQAKLYGNYRVVVPCDSAAAIAGGQKYGENKYAAVFTNPKPPSQTYSVPGVNSPTVTGWNIPCWNPSGVLLFNLQVTALPGSSIPTPASPIPDWATLVSQNDGKTRLVQSGRNIFGVFRTWLNPTTSGIGPFPPGVATVQIGNLPGDPVVEALTTMFGSGAALIAVSVFDSAPAACSTHTLLTDPLD